MKFCQGSFLFVMTLVMKTVGIQYCKRAIYQRNCVGKKKNTNIKEGEEEESLLFGIILGNTFVEHVFGL